MKKLLCVSIIAASLALCSTGFATTQQDKNAPTKNVTATEQMQELMYKGIIKKLEEGTALITETKTYPLIGGDFTADVGKTVMVFGKLVKEDDVEKIVVTKLEVNKM